MDIHDNRFVLDKSVVECTVKCDRMAVLSNYGTYPDWSPYKGERVAEAITGKQHNRWHDNVYLGPWKFVAQDQSRVLDLRAVAGHAVPAGRGQHPPRTGRWLRWAGTCGAVSCRADRTRRARGPAPNRALPAHRRSSGSSGGC